MSQETTIYVQRALSGDQESRNWVVAHFNPLLLAHAQRWLRPGYLLSSKTSADDICQETWLRFFKKVAPGTFDSSGGRFTPRLISCLRKMMYNVRNELQYRLLRDPDNISLIDIASDDDRSPILEAMKSEAAGAIMARVESLDPINKDILLGRLFEHLSFKQLGDSEQMSAGAAIKRFQRALGQLRGLFPPQVIEEFGDEGD